MENSLVIDGPYRLGVEVNRKVLVTTSNDVEGHQIVAYLGVVRGLMVRSTGFTRSFIGSFRALRAGNVKEFVDVCEKARHEAYEQMVAHAEQLNADAFVGMRYDATEFAAGISEVLAYGTAVRLERKPV